MVLLQLLAVVVASSLVSLAAIGLILERKRPRKTAATPVDNHVSLLFDGETVVDASPRAQLLLDPQPHESDWTALARSLGERFPDFPEQFPAVGPDGLDITPLDKGDPGVVRIEAVGINLRVEVDEGTDPAFGPGEFRQLKSQFARLEEVCNEAPYPAWRTDRKGRVTWYNNAYDALSQATGLDANDFSAPILSIETSETEKRRMRASIARQDRDSVSWYDVNAVPTEWGQIFHAANIDPVIQAEIAQRNFVQTLAKTFAQLATGLAVFDRNGQLALFNPALIYMTKAQPEFLSARPRLEAFFDRLREARTMPEPKNYASWRQDISHLITAASEGSYQEIWSLESGQTFKVSGHPHPDGAIAFLFEDITAEVAQARNHRGELEMNQALLDSMDCGLVVFGSSGKLMQHNKMFRDIWKMDPSLSFAEMTVIDCLYEWQQGCAPDPAWGDIRDYVVKTGERAPWDTVITRLDGSPIFISVVPIAADSTLIKFERRAPVQQDQALHSTQASR